MAAGTSASGPVAEVEFVDANIAAAKLVRTQRLASLRR